MKKRCLALFSGGLDSVLAVKIIQEQGIEVIGISFISPFFSSKGAWKAAEELNLNLETFNITKELIELIKKPRYGYGKNLNPCIDCHILMLKRAKDFLKESRASFIITGEVLNERPKSQNRRAMEIVEQQSGNTGYLLRPLSAKNLAPTIPETKGMVDRDKLLGISGRSRKAQFALVKKYNLKSFAAPSGGCLLTDSAFAMRLRDAFACGEDSINDITLLKVGRHFRTSFKNKIVVGRNEDENKKLLELAGDDDVIFEARHFPGPITILRGDKNFSSIEEAAKLTARYSDGKKDKIKISYGTIKKGFNADIWVTL